MTPPVLHEFEVGSMIANYRVVRKIGEGGMGIVYEGTRDDISSRVAIKVLREEYAGVPELAGRFFNEARAANLIQHPGIVRVFDYGKLPSGASYLVMEYLDGETLYDRMQREKAMPEIDVIRIGRQIATALAAAHAKHIVHRDLKPENIFIVPDAEAPNGERSKILDFGIAKLALDSDNNAIKTNLNIVMGTPVYMSPEQCRGSRVIDGRTDVYSLGVILYEMLAGRPPFVAVDPGEYIGKHMYERPLPVSRFAPLVGGPMQRLIEGMLLKDPPARMSMQAVAGTLKEMGNLASEVITVSALSATLDEDIQVLLREQGRELTGLADGTSSDELAVTAPDARAWAATLPGARAKLADGSEAPSVARAAERAAEGRASRPSSGAIPLAMVGKQESGRERLPSELRRGVWAPPPRPVDGASPKRGEPTPAWQSINVVKRTTPEELDSPNEGFIDPMAQTGRSLGLGQSLSAASRRLQGGARRLLGLREPKKRAVPADMQGRPKRALGSSTKVLIAASLVALASITWKVLDNHSRTVATLAPEKPAPTPTQGAGSALPDRVRPPPQPVPVAPAPLPPPVWPEPVAKVLAKAERLVRVGDLTAAMRELKAANKVAPHPAQSSVLGQLACRRGNLRTANEALVLLSGKEPETIRLRAQLVEVCRDYDLLESKSGSLVKISVAPSTTAPRDSALPSRPGLPADEPEYVRPVR